MEYIFTGLVSLAVAMLAFVLQSVLKENSRLKKEKEKADQEKKEAKQNEVCALKEGVLCLLRVKLIEYHAKYTKLGYISSHGLENWLLMYKAYKALGGNGMIDHMKEEIEKLPIE